MSLLRNGVLATGQGPAVLLLVTTWVIGGCSIEDTSVNSSAPLSEVATADDAETSPDSSGNTDDSDGTVAIPSTPVASGPVEDGADSDDTNDDERVVNEGVAEDTAIYSEDGYGEVDVIRVDLVTRTNAGVCNEDDMSGCTLADVIADIDSQDDFKVDIPVHFAASDFADDGTVNNAELRQRGGGTRLGDQKSFRIKLDDKDSLWRNERYLQLNKHPFDSSRFRNKLAFDLMIDVPDLPSFRTQFINLYIDDGEGPLDQGLYTHVERGDDDYLERHALADGNLYKANFFKFTRNDLDTLLIDEDGEPLDDDLFETVLEIENGDDHSKLIAMLEALHDPQQSFDDVLARYFDEDNVLTWMAVNFLMGQQDAVRHNYFLYNPEDSDTFYFLPWDYDSALVEHELPPSDFSEESLQQRLDYGYAVGSSNTFLNNYYRSGSAHQKILAKADALRSDVLSDATVAAQVALLKSVSSPFASEAPDINFNSAYSASTGINFDDVVAANDIALHNTFGIPLPPTLADPARVAADWLFTWPDAFDVSGSSISYELQIADTPGFIADSVLLQLTGVESGRRISAQRLGNGALYARLIARRADQPDIYWQVADNTLQQSGRNFYGVVRFED